MKRIVEIQHDTLKLLDHDADTGRIRFAVEINDAYALPAWAKMGQDSEEGVEWLDGKYLITGRRAISMRKG